MNDPQPWKPANAQQVMAYVLLAEYGLGHLPQYAGQDSIDLPLETAIAAMLPDAQSVLEALEEEGWLLTEIDRW